MTWGHRNQPTSPASPNHKELRFLLRSQNIDLGYLVSGPSPSLEGAKGDEVRFPLVPKEQEQIVRNPRAYKNIRLQVRGDEWPKRAFEGRKESP